MAKGIGTMGTLAVIGIIIAVVGLAWYFGTGGQIPSGAAVGQAVGTGGVAPTGGEATTLALQCPTTKLTTVQAAARNPENSSLWYGAPTVTYTDLNGNVKASEALTSGQTKTYSTGKSLNCGESFRAYTLSGSTYTSVVKDVGQVTGGNAYNDMNVPYASEIEMAAFTTAYANETIGASTGSFVQDATTGTNNAMSTGSILELILRYRAKTSSAQWGNDDGNNYVCADYNLAKYPKGEGVTVDRGDWVSVDISSVKWATENGYESCWKIPALSSSDGSRDVKVTIKSTLGDPADGDNIAFAWIEDNYYQGANGVIKRSSSDDSGTDTGVTNRKITPNIT